MSVLFSEDSCKQVLQLFAKHDKVITVVRESTAGKKGKVAQTKTPNSLISLSCVVSFLQAIIMYVVFSLYKLRSLNCFKDYIL